MSNGKQRTHRLTSFCQVLKAVILPESIIPEKEQYVFSYEVRDDFIGHQAPLTTALVPTPKQSGDSDVSKPKENSVIPQFFPLVYIFKYQDPSVL